MKHMCECRCGHIRYAAGKVCAKCHFNKDRNNHDRDTWTLEDTKKWHKENDLVTEG